MSEESTPAEPGQPAPAEVRPLVVIKGDASPDEVAALVAVVQALAAGSGDPAPPEPRSVWADPARRMRRPHHHSPGGWTHSGLPG